MSFDPSPMATAGLGTNTSPAPGTDVETTPPGPARARRTYGATARLQILQINLRMTTAAQDLAEQTAIDTGADLIIMSEYHHAATTGWISDTSRRAAIRSLEHPMTNCAQGYGWCAAVVEGVWLASCYASPNRRLSDLERTLRELTSSMANRPAGTTIVVAGDFNAKSPAWGDRRLDDRGRLLEEWATSADLIPVNSGGGPTCLRHNGESTVDVTLASSAKMSMIRNWKILDLKTLSDHRYIAFGIGIQEEPNMNGRMNKPNSAAMPGWATRHLDKEALALATALTTVPPTEGIRDVDQLANQLAVTSAKICNRCMPRKRAGPARRERKQKAWWNEEVRSLREDCHRSRRAWQRGRASDSERTPTLLAAWKEARKKLSTGIRKSKEEAWLRLCEEVEENPFGLAYKLVTKKLGGKRPIPGIEEPGRAETIIEGLFPSRTLSELRGEDPRETNTERDAGPPPLAITRAEVALAAKRLKGGKAPGLDGVPPEVVKSVSTWHTNEVKNVIQACIDARTFPRQWKQAKLVLLPKKDKPPELASSYRPICLLNCWGKLLEHVVAERIRRSPGYARMAETQYGFTRGRSTIDAMNRFRDLAKDATDNGRHVVAAALDISNAFNEASWRHILQALEQMEVGEVIVKMVRSYFEDRSIIYVTPEGRRIEHSMSCGVPQGSVLGPLLWNIQHDSLLKMGVPRGVTVIAFADDTLVVATSSDPARAAEKTTATVGKIAGWIQERSMRLAAHKTEALLITNRRAQARPTIRVEGASVNTEYTLKYLGVIFDRELRFHKHMEYIETRTTATIAAISRLMPNMGGPTSAKRRLLAQVAKAIALYAAPVWADALRMGTHLEKMTRLNRACALRVCKAYRTVSADASAVIAGLPPLHLEARKRKKIHETNRMDALERGERRRRLEEADAELMDEWQASWDTSTKGRWTHSLIPNIRTWYERRRARNLSYHTTQVLSGHGSFGRYLKEIRKEASARCHVCGSNEDCDVKHAVLECPVHAEARRAAGLPERATIDDLRSMIADHSKWNAFTEFSESIMRQREANEREREARGLKRGRKYNGAGPMARRRRGEATLDPEYRPRARDMPNTTTGRTRSLRRRGRNSSGGAEQGEQSHSGGSSQEEEGRNSSEGPSEEE